VSDPLLVPMGVDALLVNDYVRNQPHMEWQRFTYKWERLNDFEDPVPGLGDDLDSPPANGVHLRWRLPAAIARGSQPKPGANVEFKHFAPNRWLVARLTTGAATAAWVVESDYLDSTHGSTPFADPHASKPGSVVTTMLGRHVQLEDWSEPGGQLFLKATGVADVTFSAWQPGLVDVFSFADPMTGVAEGATVSYLIAGWYADPSADPLASETPHALGWTVLGGDETPTRTICHSLVTDLTWQTKTAPARADMDPSKLKVAVAYSSADAMAAMVSSLQGTAQPPGSELAARLGAFQRGMLHTYDHEPGGQAAVEQAVRSGWFAGRSGGTFWEIVSVAQGQATTDPLDPTVQPRPAPLDPAQAKWLADLNVAQRELDEAERGLETAQWELFALWWKDEVSARLPKDGQNPETNPAIYNSVIQAALDAAIAPSGAASQLVAVQGQQADVTTKRGGVPDPTSTTSIETWSKKIPGNAALALTLKPRTLAPFMRPTDPVVLIGGITPPETDPGAKDGLPCRLPSAAVTGVETAQEQQVTSSTGSLASVVPTIATSGLDQAVAGAVDALATEAFFADSNNAADILSLGLSVTGSDSVTALQDAMTAGTAQISTIADPLQATWAFAAWRQAWAPLFLQWEIKWRATLPTDKGGTVQVGTGLDDVQDNWQFDRTQWTFDADDGVAARGGEYHGWVGPDNWDDDQKTTPPAGTCIPPNLYSGRTFLTPHATAQLVQRLSDYLNLHKDPDLKQVQDLIEGVGATCFLSQALSGFNDGFLARALQHTPPPTDPAIAAAVAGEHRGVPVPDAGPTNMSWGEGVPFFFPLRGGFFDFQTLEVVDAFGQVLDLLEANGNLDGGAAKFVPIKGQGLAPDAGTTLPSADQRLKQAPRVVQPARLDMRLLDSEKDADEVGYAATANPICGWLLPNHLDRSIAAYDPSGAALGELLVATDPKTHAAKVAWLPAPGGGAPADPSGIESSHLSAMLMALWAPTGGIPPRDQPDALSALYASIDETLWTIEPGGGQGDQDLAALIGPPLALVRAELQFELYGHPAYNQSWRDSTLEQTACFTTVENDIRVGSTELVDDGVVGYYTGTDYTRFSASHVAGPATPHVQAIAPGNYLSLPFDYPTYSKQQVTLLVDPRGSVHATTGILPIADLDIPAQFYEPALSRIAASFRIGPVLTSPAAPRMPVPADRRGTWSWITRVTPGDTAADFATSPVIQADQQARLADAPPHLVDGWLRFAPDDVEGPK
jgi:hypothetical protein